MQRAILRKAANDLRTRPLQTALLFLVVAAAAGTLSLALTVQRSASEPYTRLARESNGAHLWVSTHAGQTGLERLADLPGVTGISGPYPISWTGVSIRSEDRKQQFAIMGMPSTLPVVDHPVVTDGRWLAAAGADEIVIDRGAARILDLNVGQQVTLLREGPSREFTVVGFAVPAGRAPAPINDPAFAYVLPETLASLEPDAVFGTSSRYPLRTGIQLANPDEPPAAFVQRAQPILQGRFELRRWIDVRENIAESNTFDIIFLDVFSLFSLAAAGLIIANTVGGQVISQVRDIGILKAIGFTPRQVTLSLLVQNLGLSLAASIAGIAGGLMAAPFFLERSAEILGVTAAPAFDPVLLAITLAAVLSLVTLFTAFPAWRAGRVVAVRSITAGTEPGGTRPSRLAALLSTIGMPRTASIGVKDLFRRPARAGMTIAALVLAVVTATFTLGIEATFSETMSNPATIGVPPYDLAVDRDLLDPGEAERILRAQPEISAFAAVYPLGGRIGADWFEIKGLGGDTSGRWLLRDGRMPGSAGEAMISQQLYDRLRLEVGERVQVQLSLPLEGVAGATATALDLVIVGRYVDVDGPFLVTTRDTLPDWVEPSDYLIRTQPGTDNRDMARALIAASGGHFDPEVLDETIAEVRDQFRPVLLGLNAVLFVIAGVNLLSSFLIATRERQRDFAVLKTIGFTPGQIAASVLYGSVVLAAVAVIVGLPLGLLATRVMFDALSSAAGIGTGVGKMPGVLWLLPIVPGAILVAALGSILPARRAAAIRITDALRDE